MKGIISEADVKSGKVQVIAPAGFMDEAISENVLAGNIMSRRALYLRSVSRTTRKAMW